VAKISEDYIPEEPRYIDRHPLLKKIYEHHDDLISEYSEEPCLDIGFGKKPFRGATHGIEPETKNVEDAPEEFEAVQGVGHDMPFEDNKFQTVVAKRVIHHFDPELREEFFEEVERVLKPGGKLIILEGTPGIFRKTTKSIGFITGILGEDNDEYGHLDEKEISDLLKETGFIQTSQRKLGSPLMPFSILNSKHSEKVFPLYKKTNFIKWWTLTVAELE
jgi:SAM-dependent methyltransferase